MSVFWKLPPRKIEFRASVSGSLYYKHICEWISETSAEFAKMDPTSYLPEVVVQILG